MTVALFLQNASAEPCELHLSAVLGRPLEAEIEVLAAEALDAATLVGTSAGIEISDNNGSVGVFRGIIASVCAVATTDPYAHRRYVLAIRSAIELLTLRADARIFRKKTAVAIVKEVLEGGGIRGEQFVSEVYTEPPEREHVTQWNETDAVFLRRICEEEGLFFRFDPNDGFDALVLCDDSTRAPAALPVPLRFIETSALRTGDVVAHLARYGRGRRTGKVTVRDYDPSHPALKLEAAATGGVDFEQSIEAYEAPARFRKDAEGKREARLRLEAQRADAEMLAFETTAYCLRPGVSFEADTSLAASYVPDGKYFVTEVAFSWRAGESTRGLCVKAIPLATPFRLPRTTAHPRIAGILSATVTGASGEEIHTDGAGCVRVRFDWDRSGPNDDKASLPVRVMQANLPGSMLIPRVGWEVLCGFEDGDPDRPYVLGRSFNGKQLPPFGLPANKTITALGTVSSPGGGKANMVHIDDGAGRQHMMWNAGFGKTTAVGGNMENQTVGFDNTQIKGNQTWNVGGDQTVSVQNAWSVGVGSQTASVAGNQSITINATGATSVASEAVTIGANLIEQVGNPATGLAEFAKAAVLSGVGDIPVVGAAISKGYTWGKAIAEGYKNGGWKGAAMAAAQSGLSEIAGHFVGVDSIVAAADGAGWTPWSEKAQKRAAQQAAGGGGAGAGAVGPGAAAAAPGHRKFVVDGAYTEAIGAVHGIQTPGSLKWTCLGASTFAVRGSHATSAVRISRLTMATSSDSAAATSIVTSAAIGRNVKAAHTLTAGGAINMEAGGEVGVTASGSLSVQADGAMSLEGGTVVFSVGDSSVSIHGGGVSLCAPEIKINGQTQHSGKESVG
jgi:type VI secretion system secreted protein VgrG